MRRHGFDALSFVFGAAFLALGLVVLGSGSEGIDLGWVGPIAAVAVSLVLIAGAWPARKKTDDPAPELDDSPDA